MNSTDESEGTTSTTSKTKAKFHHHHSKTHMKHAKNRIHRKLSVILDDVGDSTKAKVYEQELSHMADLYEKLFEGNRQFVKEKTETDPDFFNNLAKGQAPKYLLIGCSDSRVPPDQLTKTEPGEIFIHRNVANLVVNTDLNFMSVLQYAVEVLKVKHVIVLGHFGCGGVRAAMENKYHGLIDKWLRNIKDVIRLHKDELDAIIDEDEKLRLLVELNIKEQVLNLCKTSIIQKQWAQGNYYPMVHGLVYDLSSGYLKDLKIASEDWDAIESIYKIDFPPHIFKYNRTPNASTATSVPSSVTSTGQGHSFKDILDETDSDTDTVSTSESDREYSADEIETVFSNLQVEPKKQNSEKK